MRPATVGILLLETRFPRIPGDIGNTATFPFPVLLKTVPRAAPQRIVTQGARETDLLPAFIEAGRALIAEGADGITTSCGFLSLFQAELAGALRVPVATSSLMQVPLVERLLPPGRRCGVLTVDARSLTPEHLNAAGAAHDTPVAGTEGGREFTRVFLGNQLTLDRAAAAADVLAAGDDLVARHPEVAAIVLECANMGPYAQALAAHLRLPVYDIVSFVAWFHAGLAPRGF